MVANSFVYFCLSYLFHLFITIIIIIIIIIIILIGLYTLFLIVIVIMQSLSIVDKFSSFQWQLESRPTTKWTVVLLLLKRSFSQ